MIGSFLEGLQREHPGGIPFEEFMRSALYHPSLGYYTSRIRDIGRQGDFSTWPRLHGSLARAVAAWIRKNPPRHVIEVGAGTGDLMAGIVGSLGFFRSLRTSFHIVEVSPTLQQAQEARLKGKNIRWHRDMGAALDAAGGQAKIFSNELPDAFPCRVFVRAAGSWRELGLVVEGGRAREVLLEGEIPESSSLSTDAPEGSRVEVHESYRRWLRSWAASWRQGEFLTIDYGDTMPGLYRRRPLGTVRAYSHQQRLTGADVYGAFGRRDITADVNFSDLQAWGEELGWETLSLETLSDFLASRLPRGALLSSFAEAGLAFRALVQQPGSNLKKRPELP